MTIVGKLALLGGVAFVYLSVQVAIRHWLVLGSGRRTYRDPILDRADQLVSWLIAIPATVFMIVMSVAVWTLLTY